MIASKSPKEAAEAVLEEIWGSRGFPVDPVWIARQFGIQVIEMELPADVSGGIVKEEGKDPVIALEKADSKNRKRFSCAHEVGHFIQRQGEENWEYVDLRDSNSAKGTDEDEVFANQFAANLLMPEDEVRKQIQNGLPDFLLAVHFGVSDDAMHFRLKNLGPVFA